MNNPKVSVVIPIYGVERYIEKCARSLFEQTIDSIEYIFIDDCTKDDSIKILNDVINEYRGRLVKECKTVRVLKMPHNSGLPNVRKYGISISNGQYIAHCDSDDWVNPDMYKEMYERAKSVNADIVVCDSYLADGDSLIYRKGGYTDISSRCALEYMVLQKMPWTVWNKLIKRELYEKSDYIFPSKTHSEDMVFSLQLFYYASKISYIPKPFYYYVSNSNIPTHVVSDQLYLKRFSESVENVRCVEAFFKNKPEKELKDYVLYLKLTQRDNLLPVISQKKYYNLWLNTFPEINNKILFNKTIRLKHKIKYFLIRCHAGWIFTKLGRIN